MSAKDRGVLKYRCAIAGSVILTAIVCLVALDVQLTRSNRLQVPEPNVLGSTIYGPTLLLLVPIALGWMFGAVRSRAWRIAGYSVAVVLFLLCLSLIWLFYQLAHNEP